MRPGNAELADAWLRRRWRATRASRPCTRRARRGRCGEARAALRRPGAGVVFAAAPSAPTRWATSPSTIWSRCGSPATASPRLHPRPGRDPHLPGARPPARHGARAQAGGGRGALCTSPWTGARSRSCSGKGRLSAPPGQGGLPLTRMELPLTAAVHDPHRVQVDEETFPDRVGWKAAWRRRARGPPCARRRPRATPPAACATTRRTCSPARWPSAPRRSRCHRARER